MAQSPSFKLDAETIKGFSESLLALRFDDPKPTPAHHLEMWEYCCSDEEQVAIAAPRGSAKSTAVTFTYVLAAVLFREHSHVLILSANEELASGFLNDIKVELNENDALRKVFGVKRFIKETETEIVLELKDGHKFRIIVKGAEQRMRGLKWERKRPSLVVPDDLEDEALVESESRREKFRRWFMGAVKPILKEGGKIRMVGTIMHMDSLLMRFMPPDLDKNTVHEPLKTYSTGNRAWKSILYRAHTSDFKHLLWPSMYSIKRLKRIRQDFAEQGMLDVYSQEYLNNPVDMTTAYFRKGDFLPMKPGDFETHKIYYAAGDLAITKNKRSAYTALVVGGMDANRTLFITDMRRARLDSLEIADEIFSIHSRWDVDTFRIESENIEKSIGPFLYERMSTTGQYINIDAKNPTKDKESRAQTLRAMMRAGKVKFDKEADWYPDLEQELIHFPKWPTIDQVDALAWLAMLVSEMAEGYTIKEQEEEEWDDEFQDQIEIGVSLVTGY